MNKIMIPNSPERKVYGDYEVLFEINTNRPDCGVPIIVLAAIDFDTPMRFQVRRKSSVTMFATFREVQDYCRRYRRRV